MFLPQVNELPCQTSFGLRWILDRLKRLIEMTLQNIAAAQKNRNSNQCREKNAKNCFK